MLPSQGLPDRGSFPPGQQVEFLSAGRGILREGSAANTQGGVTLRQVQTGRVGAGGSPREGHPVIKRCRGRGIGSEGAHGLEVGEL